MTFIFGSFTLGTALLFSAVKNMSLLQLARGEAGPGQPPSIVDATLSKGAKQSTSTQSVTATEPFSKRGVVKFDGHLVAAWIVPWLKKARQMGWKGHVTSGWRDPAYSERLCRQMCGAPSCPGRCAGRSSNHSGKVFPKGAIDVSDEATFAVIMRKLRAPLRNDLPADRVHFSVTGH